MNARIGDSCVLKLIISSCCTICIQYVLLDYIGLHWVGGGRIGCIVVRTGLVVRFC
jgi:hypothetical protein